MANKVEQSCMARGAVEVQIWRGGGREGIIDSTERSRRLYFGLLIVGYLLFRSE